MVKSVMLCPSRTPRMYEAPVLYILKKCMCNEKKTDLTFIDCLLIKTFACTFRYRHWEG